MVASNDDKQILAFFDPCVKATEEKNPYILIKQSSFANVGDSGKENSRARGRNTEKNQDSKGEPIVLRLTPDSKQ